MRKTYINDLIEKDLGIGKFNLEALANTADKFYRTKSVGKRIIEIPSPDLKLVQCWISDFLRAVDSNVPSYVTAYEQGRSIVSNAAAHCFHAHILTMDIESFFHSCGEHLVWRMFSSLMIDIGDGSRPRRLIPDECDLLVKLTCFRGSLSVGAPSSPAIANRVMLPLDEEIAALIPSTMSYTRYSDDMTFSSDAWIDVRQIAELVSDVLSADGFRLNERKTRCCGKGNRRVVTGVVIQPNGLLSIGSKRKRYIKDSLYKLLVFGEGDPLVLLGNLYFAIQIEPDWAAKILAKYANYGRATGEGVIGALRDMVNE